MLIWDGYSWTDVDSKKSVRQQWIKEYENSDKAVSLDYFIAAKEAELVIQEQNIILKNTHDVVKYIDTYYVVIYKDVMDSYKSEFYTANEIYKKVICHLNNKFSSFDINTINAKLENYGIINDKKNNFKIKCHFTIAVIVSIITAIVLISLYNVLDGLICGGAVMAASTLGIGYNGDKQKHKRPK